MFGLSAVSPSLLVEIRPGVCVMANDPEDARKMREEIQRQKDAQDALNLHNWMMKKARRDLEVIQAVLTAGKDELKES